MEQIINYLKSLFTREVVDVTETITIEKTVNSDCLDMEFKNDVRGVAVTLNGRPLAPGEVWGLGTNFGEKRKTSFRIQKAGVGNVILYITRKKYV